MRRLFDRPLYFLIAATILCLCIAFPKFVFHPNDYFLNASGDAFKNYFTPAWYVKYDKGFHFTGMNYPFGEHIVFSDCQPSIVIVLNFIDNNIFQISNYTIGILNFLMIASILFCVILLYKIGVHYMLPKWYAAICALLIGMMSPQMERLWGHFALSYSFFIPLIWYLSIRLKTSGYATKNIIFLVFVIFFFGLVHLYYLLIAAMFLILSAIVRLLGRKKTRREIISLLVAGVMPLILITLLMKLTDHVSDRPQTPYGFFQYKASFQSVFLPKEGTMRNIFLHTLRLHPGEGEGYAYVGFLSFLIALFSLYLWCKRLLKRKKISLAFQRLPGDLNIYLVASVLILFFSMALPFSLGLQFLLDIISPLKQFRSPGRFAWIFYYVFTIYAAVMVYLLYRLLRRKKRILAMAFLIIPLALQVSDSFGYFFRTGKNLDKNASENTLTEKYFSFVLTGGVGDYDAMLYLPVVFNGSEKLYVDRTQNTFSRAMQIAYQNHLPIAEYMMSRTSLSQTMQLATIVSNPAINRNIPEELKNKNLLLVYNGTQLEPGEQYLIEKAKPVDEKNNCKFYSLNTSDILASQEEVIGKFEIRRDSLIYLKQYGIYSSDSLHIFYRNNFEHKKSPEAFLGSGSLYVEKGQVTIKEIPLDLTDSLMVDVSFWSLTYPETTAYPPLHVEFYNENGVIIRHENITAKLSTDIIGNWVRSSAQYLLLPEYKRMKVYTGNDEMINFDEVVIRDANADIYYDIGDDGSFIFNNFPIGK